MTQHPARPFHPSHPTYDALAGGVPGGAGDVTVAVQDFATGTATGNVDTTTTALGGNTPKAALVMLSFADVANGTTETATAMLGLGIIDASSQASIYAGSMSTTPETRVNRGHELGEVVDIPTINVPVRSFPADKNATGTLIANGLRLNYATNSSGVSRKGAMLFFDGADLSAKRTGINLGTGTSALDQTNPGFEPDAVIAFGNCAGDDTTGSFHSLTFGFATADGTQRCVIWGESHTVAAGGTPYQAILTDAGAGQVNPSGGSLTYKVTFGSFDASGFSVTPSASTSSDFLETLAIKCNNAKIVDFDTPTSTGSSTISGAGFTPSAAIIVLTNLEETDPTFPISTSDNMSGLGIGIVADEAWSAANRINSGSDPTDTASVTLNRAIVGPSGTNTKAIEADLTTFTSDGMTLNYTSVQGTAKKGFVLFIE